MTDIYAPRFKIEINDEQMPATAVISLDIDESIDKPGMFTLNLFESLYTEKKKQKFKWLDNDLLKPGSKVSVSFGYANMSGNFHGKIKALSPSFPSTGVPTLKVEGYDLSHGLQKTEVKVKDVDVTYSDVVSQIAKENNLKVDGVEDTSKKYKRVKRKKNESDYAFLQRLAKEIGYEFFVRDETLYFRPPKDTGPKTASFKFGENFISFNPRLTTAPAVNEVKVTAWNEKSKKRIVANATISDIKSSVGIPNFEKIVEESEGKKVKVKIEGRVVESEDEAKLLAVSELKRANNGFIEGTLECIGNPDLVPGVNIEITKVGTNWFSGLYYVKGSKHSLGDSGYTTTLNVRRCL